jgi:hypothetical protein
MKRDTRRELLKREYGDLFGALAAALSEADPIGLHAIGAPENEYGPEIAAILPRLCRAKNLADVQRIIHEEFARSFNVDAGPSAAYSGASTTVWRALERFGIRGNRANTCGT